MELGHRLINKRGPGVVEHGPWDFRESSFTLPEHQSERHWERLIDTAFPDAEPSFHEGKQTYDLEGRSLVVLRLRDRHEKAGKALVNSRNRRSPT